MYPNHVKAIHLNYIPGTYQPHLEIDDRTDAEKKFALSVVDWKQSHGAYSHVQANEPQTLGIALNDSPMGLAAWLITKFREWADCEGDLEKRFTKDELLANITLYWFTQTITSSIRMYWENSRVPLILRPDEKVTVPCGVARFPREAPFPPREWVERGYNLLHWTEMPTGGHFAAAEEPALLAEDLRTFFRNYR
jgi:pimeloyl-ACP methyl ester carboxylesterase